MNIIPALDSRSDALSLDFPDGRYRCNMTTVRGGSAMSAKHVIDGADELDELVASGYARFAVEIVSSATFTSVLELAPEGLSSHTFDLDASVIAEDGAQVRPGLIAIRDCPLPVTRLSPAWRDIGNSVAVRPGQWLARGQHSELRSPQTSLLRFVPDLALRRYEMRCRYVHPGYEILMNSDDLSECQSNEGQPAAKTIVLAAYVAALSDANRRSAFGGIEDGDEDGEVKESIGYQLEAKIKALDPECPTPGEDDYDPLRAATVLLGEEMVTFESEGIRS